MSLCVCSRNCSQYISPIPNQSQINCPYSLTPAVWGNVFFVVGPCCCCWLLLCFLAYSSLIRSCSSSRRCFRNRSACSASAITLSSLRLAALARFSRCFLVNGSSCSARGVAMCVHELCTLAIYGWTHTDEIEIHLAWFLLFLDGFPAWLAWDGLGCGRCCRDAHDARVPWRLD